MKKMNNKGFSLVELIIVIAIMAILIVVLAPQYLRYVERSRNSTDLQNATTIVDAIQIYAADPQAATPITHAADDGATITIQAAGTTTAAPTQPGIAAALTNAGIDVTQMHCSSKTAWTSYTITVHVGTDGNVSFTYAGGGEPAGVAPNETFSGRMTGN